MMRCCFSLIFPKTFQHLVLKYIIPQNMYPDRPLLCSETSRFSHIIRFTSRALLTSCTSPSATEATLKFMGNQYHLAGHTVLSGGIQNVYFYPGICISNSVPNAPLRQNVLKRQASMPQSKELSPVQCAKPHVINPKSH